MSALSCVGCSYNFTSFFNHPQEIRAKPFLVFILRIFIQLIRQFYCDVSNHSLTGKVSVIPHAGASGGTTRSLGTYAPQSNTQCRTKARNDTRTLRRHHLNPLLDLPNHTHLGFGLNLTALHVGSFAPHPIHAPRRSLEVYKH